MSLSYAWDGPGDGESPKTYSPLKAVDKAVTGGIVWFNSAGNYNAGAWYGDYSDTDGDGYHEWTNTGTSDGSSIDDREKASIYLDGKG